ncbi:MAG: SurA N-terminal domain-containing protein, partial [Pseudomonadota bacterium]
MKTAVRALGTAALLALSGLSMSLSAQTVAQPTMDNPLGLPAEINIISNDNPNERSATAIVNGYVITGTDVDQRVALVTSASNAEVSDEELNRLRVQVLRNLIDETLKIQAAEQLEMRVERGQIDQTYDQLAAQNFPQ